MFGGLCIGAAWGASDAYALLMILQALDVAGKDGTIKHVMSGVNPQGCDVVAFKSPSAEELNYDFLWRCVKALPECGRIGIFNRSYYEEVLLVSSAPITSSPPSKKPSSLSSIENHRSVKVLPSNRRCGTHGSSAPSVSVSAGAAASLAFGVTIKGSSSRYASSFTRSVTTNHASA